MSKRKQKSKITAIIVIAAILIFSAIVIHFTGGTQQLFQNTGLTQKPPADGIMRVNFIDVGQGDCTLILCGGKTILVDAGEAGESQTVINHIRNLGIKKLDCIIGTHPHSDHIGSMSYVMRAFKVGDVIIPEIPEKFAPTTVCFEKLLDAIERKAENAYYSNVGDKYTYGDMEFQILAPNRVYSDQKETSCDMNNMSVVVKLKYKDTSVMLTGDACFASEKDMLKNKYDYSADILKVGHHGSGSSSSDAWLDAVSPKYAVISCGKNNDYGHPHKQTTSKLKKRKIEFYRTDLCGDIVFESDGKTFTRITDNVDN